MGRRFLSGLVLLLALAGCGHRELTAPCSPLAFAPEHAPPAPFASFTRDECGEPRPVNALPLGQPLWGDGP
jgi:hypothetical protein